MEVYFIFINKNFFIYFMKFIKFLGGQMRSKDVNIESSRDILKKIEDNILSGMINLKQNDNLKEICENENLYLDIFLKNTNNINYYTSYKAIEKNQNLNIKW
jgi:hypothetical protein